MTAGASRVASGTRAQRRVRARPRRANARLQRRRTRWITSGEKPRPARNRACAARSAGVARRRLEAALRAPRAARCQLRLARAPGTTSGARRDAVLRQLVRGCAGCRSGPRGHEPAIRRSARPRDSGSPRASRAAPRPPHGGDRASSPDSSASPAPLAPAASAGRPGAGIGRGMAQQLAAQLEPAVLALRQQLQRAALQRQPRARTSHASRRRDGQSLTTFSLAGASASAPGSSGMPSDSRTLFSISRARSGFSRRNSRALSLPWPMFSPL